MIRAGDIVELGKSKAKFVFLGQARVLENTYNWLFYVYSKDMLNKPFNRSFLRSFEGLMIVRGTDTKVDSKALNLWYIKNKLVRCLPDICSYELSDANIVCNKPKIGYLYYCIKGSYPQYALYLGYKRFLLLDNIPLNEKEIDEMESFTIIEHINVLNKHTGYKYSRKKMPHLYEKLENLKKDV